MRMYYGEIVFVLIRIMQIMSTTIPVGLLVSICPHSPPCFAVHGAQANG